MRVTNNMLVSNMMRNLNSNLRRMDVYQSQLATGKAIQSASDDPVLASKILKYRTDISELGQFDRNVEDAQSWMEITESTVSDVGQVLQKVRELLVQASNSTNTQEETQKIANEVEQLKKQIILDGNATYAGRYIFSAYETDTKLFNSDGTYNIDVTQYKVDNKPVSKFQVSVGEEMNINTNGLDVFGVVSEPSIMQTVLGDSTSQGVAAVKSEIKGAFSLSGDYTGGLDITMAGSTFSAVVTGLDGTLSPLRKEDILDRLKAASDGTDTLGSVADVFFDAADRLVIRTKSPDGNPPSAAGWGPTDSVTGSVHTVPAAVANSAGTISDHDFPGEGMSSPFFLTANGVSKRIQVDATQLSDAAGYISALQVAADNAFGVGVFTITGGHGLQIGFELNSSPENGQKPTIQIETVVANKSALLNDLDSILEALNGGLNAEVGEYIDKIDAHINNILTVQADIGARTNRLDLIMNRLEENNISFTKLLSSAEDADMAEIIMNLKNAENVYRASLSTGAKVIQPTLTDFLR